MDQTEPSMLPVDYNGEELEFEMRIQPGYVPRVQLVVLGIKVIFETDNDERYRALIGLDQLEKSKLLMSGLLEAIAGQLEKLLTNNACLNKASVY